MTFNFYFSINKKKLISKLLSDCHGFWWFTCCQQLFKIQIQQKLEKNTFFSLSFKNWLISLLFSKNYHHYYYLFNHRAECNIIGFQNLKMVSFSALAFIHFLNNVYNEKINIYYLWLLWFYGFHSFASADFSYPCSYPHWHSLVTLMWNSVLRSKFRN